MTVVADGNTAVASIGPGAGAFGGQLPPLTMVSPSELPDYKPALARKGEPVDRVQQPANRILVGFGSGGIVYPSGS